MATRHVRVRLLHLYPDNLTELEVSFLDSFLPLFDVQDSVPRAQVESVRIGTVIRFIDYLTYGDVDVIHISTHGTRKSVSVGSENLKLTDFRRRVRDDERHIGAVVRATGCQMSSDGWVKAFIEAGALAYIAAKRQVYAKDAAIFSAAFYSSFFGTTHRGKSSEQRAFDAYRVAHAAYESFVPTSSRAQFYWHPSEEVRKKARGARTLDPIALRP
jgi:hypothetical protein